MTTLHTLNHSPDNTRIYEQLLGTIRSGDKLLLLEDAVYYCMKNNLNRTIQDIEVFALKDDAEARGIPLEDSDVNLASYEDYVRLTEQTDKLINWY